MVDTTLTLVLVQLEGISRPDASRRVKIVASRSLTLPPGVTKGSPSWSMETVGGVARALSGV